MGSFGLPGGCGGRASVARACGTLFRRGGSGGVEPEVGNGWSTGACSSLALGAGGALRVCNVFKTLLSRREVIGGDIGHNTCIEVLSAEKMMAVEGREVSACGTTWPSRLKISDAPFA